MGVLPFPQLLTEKEAADSLGVSIDTIQRMRKRGDIAFRKIGGRFKYTAEDLREYIDNQRVGPCQKTTSELQNSEISGYQSAPGRHSTRSHGSTPLPDKRSASALAQATFGKPK